MKNIGKDIKKASKNILNGEVVVFPTETVYGIGADATNKEAVDKIFKAKKRPSDNPLIVHINSLEMLNEIVENINEIEKKLIDNFWPGPISIVFKKKNIIPDNVSANLDTVAVRMPSNKIALQLISLSNKPIAAPSANVSSRPSGTCIEDVYEELKDDVSYFIDDDICEVGIESTVVRVIDDVVHILRPGKISKEDILKITDNVILDEKSMKKVLENEEVLSPGMKHKHYAPKTNCIVIHSDNDENLINKLNELIEENNNLSIMVTSEKIKNIIKKNNVNIIDLGNNLDDVSKNLFKALRKLDKLNVDVCYIQSFKTIGIGEGLMNRIVKACDYQIIQV